MAEKNMNAKISVEFEETANRQQLSSGDNLPTLFGKIKKFFTDLKPVAMSGSYNDLDDKPIVDSELDINSENLIQNKAVAEALQNVEAKKLKNYYDTRPTSANIEPTGDGGLKKFLGTSSMTEGAPPMESHIIHMDWDTTSGWDAQLAIGCGQNKVYARNKKSGEWQDWFNVADGGNADTLDGLHADSFVPRLRTVPLNDSFTQEKGVNCSGDNLGVYREYAKKSADGKTVQKYFRVFGPDGVKYTDLRVTVTDEGASWAIAGSGYTGIPFLIGGNAVLTAANKKNITGITNLGYTNANTDANLIPTINTIAFWNGAYSGVSSNLAYCKHGAFGTMATRNYSSGTEAATTANCPSGALYGQYS